MITYAEISALESSVNEILRKHKMSFKLSKHFVDDRVNDPRNTPAILIAELNSIFNRLTSRYTQDIQRLKHNATFNIRCTISHINMPCAVSRKQTHYGEHQENIVITVMRKKNWKSKDSTEFLV